ncbi:DUF2624 family protein [Anaerobacillus sp. MEB173]|uniref:DUF2624 family protein n=1 Tax=Anaerobacillus sp. MEB173 TaxID=3383345 RepID=UPI003F9097AB
MNPFIYQLVNNKINQLTVEELLQLSSQYNYSLTNNDAKKIISILHSEVINVTDEEQRKRILKRIEKEVSPKIAREIQSLIQHYTSYL